MFAEIGAGMDAVWVWVMTLPWYGKLMALLLFIIVPYWVGKFIPGGCTHV